MCVALLLGPNWVTSASAAPVTSGPRYMVRTIGNARAFVVAYDALDYSVDGAESVGVSAGSVSVVDLSLAGSSATVRLSSEAGYVVTVADGSDYVNDNSSNDNMILARGRASYVDTAFYVYNHVLRVNDASPAKMVITAQGLDAVVALDDLTDDSDDTTGVFIKGGTSTVMNLSDPSLIKVTSDNPVSIYYGIITDGAVEVLPTSGGTFHGNDAYIATPEYVGVVAMGEGYIRIVERVVSGEVVFEETMLERSVRAGDVLFVPDVRNTSAGQFNGVSTVHVSGTAIFYAYAGIGSKGASYFGSTYIPATPKSGGMTYRLSSLHAGRGNQVDILPLEPNTHFQFYWLENGIVASGNTPTQAAPYSFEIPAGEIRAIGTNAGIMKYGLIIEADAPVMIQQRHSQTVEWGTLPISPEYSPPGPPNVAEFDVTAVWVYDSYEDLVPEERLRVRFSVVDLNSDLTSVTLTKPGGGTVQLDTEPVTTEGQAPGQYSSMTLNTGYPGAAFAYEPGTYTLTATDAVNNVTVRSDSVRDFSGFDITPTQVNVPDDGAGAVELQPVYSWLSPRFNYPSYYSVQVSREETFATPGLWDIALDSVRVQAQTSIPHSRYADSPLDTDTQYYWRVMGIASTLFWGDDFAVISPTWSFQTSQTLDATPPAFTYTPRVAGVSLDTVSLQWKTDEATVAEITVAQAGGGWDTTLVDNSLGERHLATFFLGTEHGLVFTHTVKAIDQRGNESQSAESVFRIEAVADKRDPEFDTGPAAVSVGETNASITWVTNEPAAYLLYYFIYGVDPLSQPDQVVTLSDLEQVRTDWSVALTELLPDTTYYYQVQAVDRSNNNAFSPVFQFRTLAAPDGTPPRVLGAPIVKERGATEATVVWRTDEPALGKVRYGESRDALDVSAGITQERLVREHEVRLDGLSPATEYFFAVVSTDAARNSSVSDTLSFVTLAQDDTEGPRIQPRGQRAVSKGMVVINDGLAEAKWQTNEESTAKVYVTTDSTRGTDGRFSNLSAIARVLDVTTFQKVHRLILDGLTPDTDYFAQIVARDVAGNTTVGFPIDFTAPSPPGADAVGPSLRTVAHSSSITAGRAITTLDLEFDEPVVVYVRWAFEHYRVDAGRVVASTTGYERNHVLTLEFDPGTSYFYKIAAIDRSGNIYSDAGPRSGLAPSTDDNSAPTLLSATLLTRTLSVTAPDGQETLVSLGYIEVATDEPTTYTAFIFEADQVPGPAGAIIPLQVLAGTDFERRHTIIFEDLQPGVEYGLAVILSDASGNSLTWPEGAQVVKSARGFRITRTAQGRGSSFTTSATPDLDPPSIMRGPVVVGASADGVVIEWNTDEPATGTVRFSQVPATKLARGAAGEAGGEVSGTTTTTDHSITITQLDSSGTYVFVVASTDVAGNGETVSDTSTFVLQDDISPPNVLDGPSVISRTHDRAVISWTTDEASDSQVDVLERGLPVEDRAVFRLSGMSLDHVVTVTNLKADTEYDFLISSYDATQNGPTIALGEFITLSLPDTDMPVIISAPSVIDKDDISAKIAWATDEATDTYVDYGATTSYGLVAQSPTPAMSHEVVLTNLQAGVKYYYRVQAEDAAGNLYEQAAPDSFTTDSQPDLTPPATPANVSAIAGNAQVYLTWDPVDDQDLLGYNVERSTDGVNFAAVATNLQAASFLDATVSNMVVYTYRVRAVDDSRSRNKSDYGLSNTMTPQANLGPETPVAGQYYYLYYNLDSSEGELFRPVFKTVNVPDVPREGAVMSYQYVVSTGPEFGSILATSSRVAPGDSIIGTIQSWYPAAMVNIDSSWATWKLMDADLTATAWVPTRNLTPGQDYYWRVRAHDGIFHGGWSPTYQFSTSSTVVLLDPRRAEFFDINLVPEQPREREKTTAVALATFTAAGTPSGVRLNWSVLDDGDAIGVKLLRGTSMAFTSHTLLDDVLRPLDGEFVDVSVAPGVTYYYRLLVPLNSGDHRELGLVAGTRAMPSRFTVSQNRPNPFNPTTVIPYALPDESRVSVRIFDITGRHVRTLMGGERQSAGWYRLTWDGADASGREAGSGIYLYRFDRTSIETGLSQSHIGRMSLVR